MSEIVTEALERPGASALRVGMTLGGIVLAAVVVFSLGVMEGSRLAALVPATTPPPSALPTENLTTQPALAVPTTPIPPDKLTFYDRLSGAAPSASVALPDGQAPAEGLAPAAPGPAAAPAAAPTSPPPQAKAAAGLRKASAGTVAAPALEPAARIRKLAGKGRFTVQLAAVGDRAAAAETAALVKRDGFSAVTAAVSVKGKTMYRIRVGSFPSKLAATQAAEIFRSAYRLNAIPAEN